MTQSSPHHTLPYQAPPGRTLPRQTKADRTPPSPTSTTNQDLASPYRARPCQTGPCTALSRPAMPDRNHKLTPSEHLLHVRMLLLVAFHTSRFKVAGMIRAMFAQWQHMMNVAAVQFYGYIAIPALTAITRIHPLAQHTPRCIWHPMEPLIFSTIQNEVIHTLPDQTRPDRAQPDPAMPKNTISRHTRHYPTAPHHFTPRLCLATKSIASIENNVFVELKGISEHHARLIKRIALSMNMQRWTQHHIPILILFNDDQECALFLAWFLFVHASPYRAAPHRDSPRQTQPGHAVSRHAIPRQTPATKLPAYLKPFDHEQAKARAVIANAYMLSGLNQDFIQCLRVNVVIINDKLKFKTPTSMECWTHSRHMGTVDSDHARIQVQRLVGIFIKFIGLWDVMRDSVGLDFERRLNQVAIGLASFAGNLKSATGFGHGTEDVLCWLVDAILVSIEVVVPFLRIVRTASTFLAALRYIAQARNGHAMLHERTNATNRNGNGIHTCAPNLETQSPACPPRSNLLRVTDLVDKRDPAIICELGHENVRDPQRFHYREQVFKCQ